MSQHAMKYASLSISRILANPLQVVKKHPIPCPLPCKHLCGHIQYILALTRVNGVGSSLCFHRDSIIGERPCHVLFQECKTMIHVTTQCQVFHHVFKASALVSGTAPNHRPCSRGTSKKVTAPHSQRRLD